VSMSTCAKNQKDINFFEVKAHIAWAISLIQWWLCMPFSVSPYSTDIST